jgi:hypothetical protein
MLASMLCVAQSSQGAGRFATASTSFAGMEHDGGLAMNREGTMRRSIAMTAGFFALLSVDAAVPQNPPGRLRPRDAGLLAPARAET